MVTTLISAVFLALLVVPAFGSGMEDRWNSKPIPDNVDSETGISTSGSSSSTPPPPLPCSIGRGFYGEESEEVTVVHFQYEVEVNKASEKSIEDVIGNIELGIANNVLPTLIPECPSPTVPAVTTRLGGRKLQQVKGLSTMPADSVLPGVNCEIALIDDENPCYVVDSAFKVYSVEKSSSIESVAMKAVKGAASNGLLNDSDVVQITVVDIDPNAAITDVKPNTKQKSNDDDSSIAATVYISISAGVVLIVTVAIMYRRRRNQSSVDADSTIMTPSVQPNRQKTETPVYDLNKVT
mmetsp:Transcript_14488/g.22362  ORF Transcript_14488/g.22362 Transcript_14488/m.22362 type:complete len:295 (+) Transcript_14488:36-920(+)